MATETAKKFRMSEFVKDGYLAKALRAELADFKGPELELAEGAVTEVATSGITGTFDELLAEYRRAIRRATQPDRKVVPNAKIDRTIIKNAKLAALLDHELEDVTREELARANAAVKQILTDMANVSATGAAGSERTVEHIPSPICQVKGEHSTLGGACGYFRVPEAWPDVFRDAVRAAIAG